MYIYCLKFYNSTNKIYFIIGNKKQTLRYEKLEFGENKHSLRKKVRQQPLPCQRPKMTKEIYGRNSVANYRDE